MVLDMIKWTLKLVLRKVIAQGRLTSGIKVSNTPGAVVAATADVGIFLLIGAIRNFNRGLMELRRGNWKKNVSRGHDPEGKIMGVLGMGDIGQVIQSKG
jgi:glyoxylate reductase